MMIVFIKTINLYFFSAYFVTYPVGEKGDAPENPIGCAPNGDVPAGRKN